MTWLCVLVEATIKMSPAFSDLRPSSPDACDECCLRNDRVLRPVAARCCQTPSRRNWWLSCRFVLELESRSPPARCRWMSPVNAGVWLFSTPRMVLRDVVTWAFLSL